MADNPIPATRTGYTFAGYYTGTGKTGTQCISSAGKGLAATLTKTIASNTTLYAGWTEHTATLTYNNGGHGTAPANVTMKYSTATTAASMTSPVDGYRFTGWKRSDTNAIIQPGATVKAANTEPSALTLTAQ